MDTIPHCTCHWIKRVVYFHISVLFWIFDSNASSSLRSLFGDEKGFTGVPPIVMVKCLHKGFNHPGDLTSKIGSLANVHGEYGPWGFTNEGSA